VYITQISVFVENKPGRLADIAGIIAEAGIDIRALSLADTTDFGILRLIVNDPERAAGALKAHGLTVNRTNVIGVALEDRPGALYSVLDILRRESIGVEYTYAFITRKTDGAFVILRVADNERAAQALISHGVALLESSEVYEI